jgi:hypothetical protein
MAEERLNCALETMSMSGSVAIRMGGFRRVYEQVVSPSGGFLPLESGVYLLDFEGPRVVPYTMFVADVSKHGIDEYTSPQVLKWQIVRPAPRPPS